MNCQPAAQVKVVAGMIETLGKLRKLLGAAVEIGFGLVLLVVGVDTFSTVFNPAEAPLFRWVGPGALVCGGIVTFYSVRRLRALLEVYGLTPPLPALPQLKFPRLTFRRKRKLLEPYDDETFAAMIAAIENPPTIPVHIARAEWICALIAGFAGGAYFVRELHSWPVIAPSLGGWRVVPSLVAAAVGGLFVYLAGQLSWYAYNRLAEKYHRFGARRLQREIERLKFQKWQRQENQVGLQN
jgi:hypothetical protein